MKTKFLILLLILLGTPQLLWAGGSSTYYYKAKATVGTGEGKVYASTSSKEESKRDYDGYTKNPTTLDWDSDDNGTTEHSVYLYAQPAEGYKFNNWTLNGKQLSTSPECYQTVPGIDNKNSVSNYVANFVTSDTKLEGLRDGFFRIKNKKTGNYINVVNDIKVDYQTIIAHNGGALLSLVKMNAVFKELSDNYISKDLKMQSDADNVSCILYLTQNGNKYDVGCEGTSLSTLATGKYHGDNAGDVTFTDCYAIFTKLSNGNYQISLNPKVTAVKLGQTLTDYTAYFYDNGTFGLSLDKPKDTAEEYQWVVEPVEYFYVKPDVETADAEGNYWATLTTAFPYTIPSDGGVLGAYTVTSDNITDNNGVKVVEPTLLYKPGETVSAETPVLLKLSSKDAANNKLVPTGNHVVGNSSNQLTKNLLTGVYMDNKKDVGSNRTLGVKDGKLAFISGSGKMAANRAYLNYTTADVYFDKPSNTKTLAEVVKLNTATTGVTIAGKDLEGVTTVTAGDNQYLIVKDGNGNSIEKTSNSNNYKTYLVDATYAGAENRKEQTAYDQSNWIMVKVDNPTNYVGKKISSMTGDYNTTNPKFTATSITAGGDVESTYVPNFYIAPNFMTSASSNAVQGADGNNYFFMNPKDGEYAYITWVVWNKEKQAFYVPAKAKNSTGNGYINGHDFAGGFKIDLTYNDDITDVSSLEDGSVYQFAAIIMKKAASTSGAPTRVEANTTAYSTIYTVYPLTLSNASIVTAVNDVTASKTVKSVTYYNTLGMASNVPFAGMNVVVTTYTDGSKRTVKQLMR